MAWLWRVLLVAGARWKVVAALRNNHIIRSNGGSSRYSLSCMASIHVVVASKARHKSFSWCIVEILGLLADAVMTMFLQATLYASQTWPFVACLAVSMLYGSASGIINQVQLANLNIPQVRCAL